MVKNELLTALVRRAISYRPKPDICLDKKNLKMLLFARSEINKEEIDQYDEAVNHLANCRFCVNELKKLQLVDQRYLIALAKTAAEEAKFRKELEKVDLTISFASNEETGKQEVHVSYISPPYYMPHEHEEKGREIILNRLIEKGVISDKDSEGVIVTREDGSFKIEDDISVNKRLKKKDH